RQRPPTEMGQEIRRDASVVLDDVALGQPDVGEHHAIGVGDRHLRVVHRYDLPAGAEWSGMAAIDDHPVVRARTRRVLAVLAGSVLVAVVVGMTLLAVGGHRQLELASPGPRVAATVVSVRYE